MISLIDAPSRGMILSTGPLPQFIQATPTGLLLDDDVSFEEWQAIATSFGKALNAAAWCIGDWLVYGERKWGKQLLMEGEAFDPAKPNRIPSHAFDAAVAATNLDRQTLSQYASVCRAIPHGSRRDGISFAHHRLLSSLPEPKREEWLSLIDSESKRPTVKRLALSLRISPESPRIVTDKEIMARGSHVGHDNYVPHLTRLLTVLRRTVPGMDQDQRRALKQDAAQLVELLETL